MRSLRELLTTWENWSARNTLIRAIEGADTDEMRDALLQGLTKSPDVGPLEALRDAAELVSLLSGWQWQAIYAARVGGASWAEVGDTLGIGGGRRSSLVRRFA